MLRQYRDATRAVAGNHGFEVLEEMGRPHRFVLFETWLDGEAWRRHKEGAADAAWIERLGGILVGGLHPRLYGSIGTSSLLWGPPDILYVVAHVDVFPAFTESASALLKAQAPAARLEPGNRRYDVLQWEEHPNHFTVLTAWRDTEAWAAHTSAAHTLTFRRALMPLEGSPFDDRLYRSAP
jgi:quinol monooxygenase YgiN